MATKTGLINYLNGLTVTGAPTDTYPKLETDEGSGAERITTYNYNGIFKTGINTADKFDVPFYVTGEGDPSEQAFIKDAGAAEKVFNAELSTYIDGITPVYGFRIDAKDPQKRVATVQVIIEDSQNAGEYVTEWRLVRDIGTGGNVNFQNYPYTPPA